MDLLLDVNVILDLCAPRIEWHQQASEAIERCKLQSGRLWLYAGSVQTMIYNLHYEIRRVRPGVSPKAAMRLALEQLKAFSQDKHWLASLAGEGDVFAAYDPEGEQLLLALDRFSEGAIKLLTRDKHILDNNPDKTISPEAYCKMQVAVPPFSFVDLKTQQDIIRPQLEKNIHTVLNHGRYILGPEVKELENQLASYTKAKHCLTVSSGTDALLMPLMAWDIGPGDAVFTTPFTFIATAEVIQLLGATPVFVDIDPETFNIDPKKLDLAIQAVKANDPSIYPLPQALGRNPQTTLRPKAVIPVDLFGLPADYDPIMEIARQHHLLVLADSAQGFGGEYKGRKTGTFGHATATSFFPAKPLGGYGDGGAIFTNNTELADKLESIRVHGKGQDKYDNIRIGLNARLDTLQAAVLLPKLKIFAQELEAKQLIAEKYTTLLIAQCAKLKTPLVPENLRSAWAQYSILAESSIQRERIQTALKNQNIPSMIYYPTPLHSQTAFAFLGYQTGDFPIAEDISQRIFSLPMHAYLDDRNQEQIVNTIETATK